MTKARKLAQLKQWLTIGEAAQYLALVFGEDVTEADVLRYGLDGVLTLSVRWANPVKARAVPEADPIPSPSELSKITPILLGAGVYDLPMIGYERLDVEHQFRLSTGGPRVDRPYLAGTFVDSPDGSRFQVLDMKQSEAARLFADSPADRLPGESVFVIRPAALRQFEANVLVDSTGPDPDFIERPLKKREQGTLVTIIAALAKHGGFDWSKPSKAAGMIEGLTIQLGAKVSARTIENKLKLIPEALARRGNEGP